MPKSCAPAPQDLQVQGGVSIDVHHMGLHLEAALQQELHNFVVSKSTAEVQRNMVFVVLCIHCHSTQKETKESILYLT